MSKEILFFIQNPNALTTQLADLGGNLDDFKAFFPLATVDIPSEINVFLNISVTTSNILHYSL